MENLFNSVLGGHEHHERHFGRRASAQEAAPRVLRGAAHAHHARRATMHACSGSDAFG